MIVEVEYKKDIIHTGQFKIDWESAGVQRYLRAIEKELK